MNKHLFVGFMLLLSGRLTFGQQTERQRVEATVLDYLDGGTYGDTTRLIRAFHPSASMKFVDKTTGQFRDAPIAEYLNRMKPSAGQRLNRTTRILAVDITGTAAQAKLEIDAPTHIFIDYFNLLKIDGRWQVVSKIFNRIDKAPRFAPDTIATNDMFGLTISPDGQTAYFVKSYGGRDTLHLYTARRQDGRWLKPTKASFSGRYKDIDPFFSPDGNVLLFNSNRPKPGRKDIKDFDIWTVKKGTKGWSQPYHLGDLINSDSSDFYATVATNGNIYFTSTRPGGQGKSDLWRSVNRDGVYQKPENLGASLNTTAGESNPCISPTEDYLIFAGDTNLVGYGDGDLYISFNQNGRWSIPQNLGADINTADAEFSPTLTDAGKTLLFGRIKRGKPLVENVHVVRQFDKLVERLRASARFDS
ncbi:nuclear transport factor 2 family protein [Spirosoma soli]|uniref:Nuclear transport factor 2 family protein n=1 Tax=Spirosoma soli TaxID=1770529 RepID=A0ABW5MDJ6_9BACT